MRTSTLQIGGRSLPLISLNTLIVGSGAAALNAAVNLHRLGRTDIAVATEAFGAGTSFNTGSDKQTYYKLSLAGGPGDSPRAMAADLFAGGCMHGDIALAEAAGSARAFFNLVELGVPFPHDPYGAFAGYKTDHDPRQRATSAGPLTSRIMSEILARDVRRRRIRIFDHHPIIALLTAPEGDGTRVIGAVALDAGRTSRGRSGFVVFNAVNIILATGGPAGIYKDSVYPESQTGSHGLAFAAGAVGHNLTEWQFGLASIKFRWNLSGTYQQSIPRYFSTDARGRDEREFLKAHFPDPGRLATAVFLKGYQWPFDPRKVASFGSSLIDLLVHRETAVLGRRVFLDFRRRTGPAGAAPDIRFEDLGAEAREYLRRSEALLPTPYERLMKMNPPAVELYRAHGIDLEREPLEIAVCAQHNNGGLRADRWWQSNIRRLFPIGEVNGTHGVYRPGGSALNSGQVGGFRAALYIARRGAELPPADGRFRGAAEAQIEAVAAQAQAMVRSGADGRRTIDRARREFRRRMTSVAALVRDPPAVARESAAAWRQWERLRRGLRVSSPAEWPEAFRTLDLCLTQAVYLDALREYLDKNGRSRGSYLVLDPGGQKPAPTLGEDWRFSLAKAGDFTSRKILEIRLDTDGRPEKTWVDIRPLPKDDGWFENVWSDFREDRTIR
jgi:succinate dehydrogenase/fumarate reductase flavoprotein subunit